MHDGPEHVWREFKNYPPLKGQYVALKEEIQTQNINEVITQNCHYLPITE